MWKLAAASLASLVLGTGLLLQAHSSAAAAPSSSNDPSSSDDPLRLGVIGMEHGHVHGFLQARPYQGIELVGFAESDTALSAEIAEQYDLSRDRLHDTPKAMLEAESLDAVVVFTSTFDHRRVVETTASHGAHVMVEKPLAVNMEHARAIQKAAETHGVHVLVNYETTWYPSTERAFALAREQERLGPLRKVVVRDGHSGPKEIGVGSAFLSWLTDPKLNGDGALMDFGCYGANLVTWLMEGQRPQTVTAITQQFKSDPDYEGVDDEATILLTYPGTQAIIQASWNWPYSRKDLSIYGQRGYVHADDATQLRVRVKDEEERQLSIEEEPSFYEAAIPYFKKVAQGTIEPDGLSSLELNMTVMEILDAARRSAKTGRTVSLQ